MEQAIQAAGASGTRSILDMQRVADDPDYPGYGVITPSEVEFLLERFGTEHPTREMIEDGLDTLEGVDRGQGIYTIIYRDGEPSEILFASAEPAPISGNATEEKSCWETNIFRSL